MNWEIRLQEPDELCIISLEFGGINIREFIVEWDKLVLYDARLLEPLGREGPVTLSFWRKDFGVFGF